MNSKTNKEAGMLASIRNFEMKYETDRNNYRKGDVVVRIADCETGECHHYKCSDRKTAEYICNSYYQGNGRPHIDIVIWGWHGSGEWFCSLLEHKECAPWIKQQRDSSTDHLWGYIFDPAEHLYCLYD